MLDEYEFVLCLTHDVDRVYKRLQAPYYAVKERDWRHVVDLVNTERPYWQFDTMMDIERDLAVTSSVYFLTEKQLFRDKPPTEWIRPSNWSLFTGHYDVTDDELLEMIQRLDAGGWEIGLHGSYESFVDFARLRHEKTRLEGVLEDTITGGRQHYLNLSIPETWEYHRRIGLDYDASLGSSTEYGFHYGYDVLRPFDDEFAVFPLTAMDCALWDGSGAVTPAMTECTRLLEEARANQAVMTILWHPRFFNKDEFTGYTSLYRHLIESATDMGAWVGPCHEAYTQLVAP